MQSTDDDGVIATVATVNSLLLHGDIIILIISLWWPHSFLVWHTIAKIKPEVYFGIFFIPF